MPTDKSVKSIFLLTKTLLLAPPSSRSALAIEILLPKT